MARQTVRNTTSTTRTVVTVRATPKPRSEINEQRSRQAKKQKRGANGRFV